MGIFGKEFQGSRVPEAGVFEHLKLSDPREQVIDHYMNFVLQGSLVPNLEASIATKLTQVFPDWFLWTIYGSVATE